LKDILADNSEGLSVRKLHSAHDAALSLGATNNRFALKINQSFEEIWHRRTSTRVLI